MMNYSSGSQSEPYDPAGDHIDFERATGEGWKIRGPKYILSGPPKLQCMNKIFQI
jgi:hypothetical protein